jgi:hypothetical protein
MLEKKSSGFCKKFEASGQIEIKEHFTFRATIPRYTFKKVAIHSNLAFSCSSQHKYLLDQSICVLFLPIKALVATMRRNTGNSLAFTSTINFE